jgi:transmembrane sensor
MEIEPDRLKQLFREYLDNTISREDHVLLWKLLQEQHNLPLDAELIALWQQSTRESALVSNEEWDQQISVLIKKTDQQDETPLHQISSKPKIPRFFSYAAAAAVLFLILLGFYRFAGAPEKKVEQAGNAKVQQPVDIPAGKDYAVLTLADGSTIVLDTAVSGALAQQGGTKLINQDGQLTYALQGPATEVFYNTVSTPRGGQYHLVLPDGSKVWLNSASSLRFPTAFAGDERRVELTGEGYFEVAHDVSKPFRVQKGNNTVEVLGTHFNINAYEDESSMRVTLLEGKVKVQSGKQSLLITPGTQALIPVSGDIMLNPDVNLSEVMAWKDGFFKFNNTDIQTMLRQAARWYDIEISYPEGVPADKFTGSLPRKVSLLEFLKILEYSDVKAGLTGRTVIVKR